MGMVAGVVLLVVIVVIISAVAVSRSKTRQSKSPDQAGLQQPYAQQAPGKDKTEIVVIDRKQSFGRTDLWPSTVSDELRLYLSAGIQRIFQTDAPSQAGARPRVGEAGDQRLLDDALARLDGLNQFRDAQARLQKMLYDPAVQMRDLSKMITSDPVMTAKILKMANSSYFGVQQKIDSIGQALMILGLQNVKNILYREDMRGLFQSASKQDRKTVNALWRHANLASVCAQQLHDLFEGFQLNQGALFTLGILHDIGKLILIDIVRSGGKTASVQEYPLDILIGEEDQFFGINHAAIGGCVLKRWNFSAMMTQTVLMHHAPSFDDIHDLKLPDETLRYVLALFLADQASALYAGWNEATSRLYGLNTSFHPLIDKKKFLNKLLDPNFLAQIRAAEMLSGEESSS